jgi:integrase
MPPAVHASTRTESPFCGEIHLHALRHFYCSWLISRGRAPKAIQVEMGHSSLVLTLDVMVTCSTAGRCRRDGPRRGSFAGA